VANEGALYLQVRRRALHRAARAESRESILDAARRPAQSLFIADTMKRQVGLDEPVAPARADIPHCPPQGKLAGRGRRGSRAGAADLRVVTPLSTGISTCGELRCVLVGRTLLNTAFMRHRIT